MPIGVYVFDAYGTLFDVHSAVRRHADGLGPDAQKLSEIWRAKQLEYTWVRALAGRYRDFWELTADALDYAFSFVAPDRLALRPLLLEAFKHPEPFPEVRGVLEHLKSGGVRTAILSNGTMEMLTTVVAAAGMAKLFDEIISVDPVRTYKSDPRVYALVKDRLYVDPSSVSFQSSNRWDVAGAVACGFHAVWVNRTGQPDEYDDLPPHSEIQSLSGLIAAAR